MSDRTAIEWTHIPGYIPATWNPVAGCTRVSEGCRNCYAERMAARFSDPGMWWHGYAERTSAGGRWTGRVELQPDKLDIPLRARRPRCYFVNSTSDLFHERLPDEAIDRVFAVMALAPQHIFIVLTKRAARMREYLRQIQDDERDTHRWAGAAVEVSRSPCAAGMVEDRDWPLPNVWLGVSIEDQVSAVQLIPDLLATPAAVRLVSAEPLLAPIDLTRLRLLHGRKNALTGTLWIPGCGSVSSSTIPGRRLDWVIVGGESGPGARPMHPDWARSLRDQCVTASVPFFFKQWGEWFPKLSADEASWHPGADLTCDRRFVRLGKRYSGRLLDGRTWEQWP